MDARVSMKRILPHITHTVTIDFQNVINRLNGTTNSMMLRRKKW
ncbi:MAG: hypothetical protein SH857_05980 [Chitinophagales bacterium]|nr:hypothetical protein [Chitinophagales bacterium]